MIVMSTLYDYVVIIKYETISILIQRYRTFPCEFLKFFIHFSISLVGKNQYLVCEQ